ncbi:MAG: tRNA-binding protein [Candidatus Marinimicrobia bacterium]|nr:tRNA-binding protein [Candidatus Neomarinimicrobiota bacterium]MCF7829035.1 tRNA-binding protein [Candidatus Neomarinimicrobiota bacterium]MCF7881828.1 tRNA-binding protein [Candidatus Neomarinimicrobiota bacterium]
MSQTTYDTFAKLDIRAGTIISAEEFREARQPAYKLIIDFGELGVKQSSAQITDLYSLEELEGTQIIAVVNFPPKQIGPFISEVLVLGVDTDDGVVLLRPDSAIKNGSVVY